MNNNVIKAIITAATGFLSSVLGILYIPVLLMVACNLIDYITGLVAAKYRTDGGISSYRSMKGITKKVMMWLLVVVGAIIDEVLAYTSVTLRVAMPFTFLVACIVAIWIICNEIISILENMLDIGVDIPAFLLPMMKNIKRQAEGVTGIEEDKEE